MSAIETTFQRPERIVAHDLDVASIDYEAIQDPGHGHSTASWVLVFVVVLGSIVSTVGLDMGNWMIFWVGGGICVLGVVLGLVLKAAGMGVKKGSHHK